MKFILYIIIGLLTFTSAYSLEIIKQQDQSGVVQTEEMSFWDEVMASMNWPLIIGIIIIALFAGLFLFLFLKLIFWFINKFKDLKKSSDDILYYKYYLDYKACRINADKKFRSRNPLTLFITTKRAKVYAETSSEKKFIGLYEGHVVKKEPPGFFVMAILQKEGLFNHETDLVIFPENLRKDLVRFNEDGSINLYCEGIDEVMSCEYFSIPVMRDDKKDKNFVDFSELVQQKYYEPFVKRDMIRDNLEVYRENVREATEVNPYIQVDRKTDKLKE